MSTGAEYLRRGILWNLSSFALIAVSGVLINILIGYFYSSDALGIFNQAFAVFIVFSQFSTLGLHYSSLKFTSELYKDKNEIVNVVSTSIQLSLMLSICVVGFSWLISPWIEKMFSSEFVYKAWLYILPGLLFISVNKVLLGIINGLRRMRVFAVFSALRYLFMLFALLILAHFKVEMECLTLIISISESMLFVLLLMYVFFSLKIPLIRYSNAWLKRVWLFGTKSFISGAIVELNSRVDVIMLGIYLTDSMVGVYSFALFIIEGLLQISLVVRNNINPLIAEYFTNSQIGKLEELFKKTLFYFYPVMIVVIICAIMFYPIFTSFLYGDSDFLNGYYPFVILAISVALISGYIPLSMALLQAGFPSSYSLMMFYVVGINIISNTILVPNYGMIGAAFGTGLSYLALMCLLKFYIRQKLRINI